jgi:photosystem II stability/assembly factor-like uncharacterized protein
MKKILVLAISIMFIAAGCDVFSGDLFGSSSIKGVFKSEDGGKTFKPYNLVSGKKANLNSLAVTDLVFDPSNQEIIYISSTSGIYKSTDKASTWTMILSNISVRDIDVSGSFQALVFACGVSAGNGKIIKTSDGGATWIDLYTEPNKSNPVIGVAVSKVNEKNVYAVLNSGEFIRSTDSGATWTNLHKFDDAPVKLITEKFGGVYVLTAKKGLFYSSNSGSSWSALTSNLTTDFIQSLGNNNLSASAFYDFTLDFRQNNVIYLVTDIGLLRSVNNGSNWSLIKLPYKTATLRIGSVAISPFDSNKIFVGVGYILMSTVNGGISWETKELATQAAVKQVVIDPGNQYAIYIGLTDRK